MGELAELAWRPNLGTIQSSSDAGVAWEDAALHLLSNKRGAIAELVFKVHRVRGSHVSKTARPFDSAQGRLWGTPFLSIMRKAVSLGFGVARP